MNRTIQHLGPQRDELPKVALFGVASFLLLNALLLPVWAWGIAVSLIFWLVLTRQGGLALPKQLAWVMLSPLLIILLGLQGFYSYPLGDVAKDIWYFAGPLIYLAFGYFVAERVIKFKHIVYVFSVVGTLVSTYTLYHVYTHRATLLAAASAEQYRQALGAGAGQSMIPVVLIAIARRAEIDLGVLDTYPALRYLVSVLGSLAIALSLSRTLLIILIAGLALTWTRSMLLKRTAIVLALVCCAMLLPKVRAVSGNAVSTSFLDKIEHTGQEISPGNYGSMSQINDNWRGFEGYRALETYAELSGIKHFVGGGFGTLVNLGFNMNLGGPTNIQEIPILHNGYLYLLVKTGLVGVLLFLLFTLQLGLLGRRLLSSQEKNARGYGFILLWSALTFVMTQAVITGIYNKGVLASNLMLVGMVMALYARGGERVVASARVELQIAPHWPAQARWAPSGRTVRSTPMVITGTVLTSRLVRQCE